MKAGHVMKTKIEWLEYFLYHYPVFVNCRFLGVDGKQLRKIVENTDFLWQVLAWLAPLLLSVITNHLVDLDTCPLLIFFLQTAYSGFPSRITPTSCPPSNQRRNESLMFNPALRKGQEILPKSISVPF